MPIWRVLIILYRVFYQNSPSQFLRVVFQVSPQFFSWATRFSRNCGFHGTALSCTGSFCIVVLRHFRVVHICSVPLVPEWYHLLIQLSVSGRLCWMRIVLFWRTLIGKCLFNLCVWYVNMCVHVCIYVWAVGHGVSCRVCAHLYMCVCRGISCYVWRINSSGIAPHFSLCGDGILLLTAARARLGSGLLGILLSPLLVPPDPHFTIGALGYTVSVVGLFSDVSLGVEILTLACMTSAFPDEQSPQLSSETCKFVF